MHMMERTGEGSIGTERRLPMLVRGECSLEQRLSEEE